MIGYYALSMPIVLIIVLILMVIFENDRDKDGSDFLLACMISVVWPIVLIILALHGIITFVSWIDSKRKNKNELS